MEENKKEEVLQEEELNTEINSDENWQQSEIEEDIEFENSDSAEEVAKLRGENLKLTNELEALKDRLLRLNAEYENFRKRTVKEKEGIYTEACEDVLKDMFPVLDNLERAIAVEGSADDIKKGVDMTIRQFNNAFEKLGVEEIDTANGFDPNYHSAVMHIQDENLGANAIAEVFQKGYKRGEKVLRFTMVKVAN